MIWNVEGADARTGAERAVSVVAESETEAERKASEQGLLVSAVFPSTIAAAKPFDPAALPIAAAVAEPSPAMATPAAVPTVAYRGLYTKSPSAFRQQRKWSLPWQPWHWRWTWDRPPYFHLRLASRVLGVLAVLSYISGLLAVLLGVVRFFRQLDLLANILGGLYDLFTLVSPLILGGLLHAAAAACDALRDIALASLPRAKPSPTGEALLREQQRNGKTVE